VESAHTAVTSLELQIEQTENQLDVLLGRNPQRSSADVPSSNRTISDLPAGLPSRCSNAGRHSPAEQQLIANHALVAVAKAAYFQCCVSRRLPDSRVRTARPFQRLRSGMVNWSSRKSAAFSRRQHRAGVRSAEAIQQQALLLYEQTVQEPSAK